jgi:protein TonB
MSLAEPAPRWWRAAALALVVEAVVLIGAGWIVNPPRPSASVRDEIQLDLTALPPADVPKPPESEPPKVEPVKPEPPKSQVKPEPRKQALPPPIPLKTVPPPAGPMSAAASDFALPPPTPPIEPTPVRSVADTSAVLDLFQAQARAAVQAALRYPNAARIRKLVGQCRLGFDYRDGQASGAHIVASSGYDILDDAAVAALTNATLPSPPPDLAGHLLKLTIAVNFSLQP